MATGSSSQQNFRKAIGAIKDTTLVGMAKVNSEYKELTVSILKATNHVEVLPKEKHVRTILGAVSGSRPRADVAYCIHAITRRLAKTHTWVVALKTLIIIHRALREVDQSFCEELIIHNTNGHLLNLLHFKDDSSLSAWDYSNWIRTYALYIEEWITRYVFYLAVENLYFTFYLVKWPLDFLVADSACKCYLNPRTKKFDTASLLEQLPALQQLLFRLLACQPVGAARYNFMIQYALSIVAAESVRLYVAITDGVLILVDKFFEMPRRDAVRALEIYRKSQEQAQKLSDFFEMCRSLEFGRRQKYVKIEQPPVSFLTAMEEYVKDAPQTLMLPWKPNDDACSTPKLTAVPDANLETDPEQATAEESHPSGDSQEDTKTDKSNADSAPLIPDLLSWDEPSQETSQLDGRNSLSLAITSPEELLTSTKGSELSSEPSWELALITTPSSNVAPVEQSKTNLLDRSVLDSLYDDALKKTNTNGTYQLTNVSSNPFESDSYNQEMFYNPSLTGHPSYMQIAGIPQQQAAIMQQQDQSMVVYDYMQIAGIPQQQAAVMQQPDDTQKQPMTGYDYMQIAEIPQQPPALAEQKPDQQQESSVVGHDFMQMIELPELEAPMEQEQQQEKPTVGFDSTNPFGNPFIEQGPLPVAPESQSPNSSLI
ncbi:Clathrin assembly protein AP180 [Handroanthus impetiginosus]|uniref:Clathrin assembly protein AP180 n=1 Tax=Handroanthus impetiginosus TaxID=429701 RepID=A0A2G9HWL5_9LAMI|nr:Clathrin assembly protein AP180 [Handroanthus impetiginosus]